MTQALLVSNVPQDLTHSSDELFACERLPCDMPHLLPDNYGFCLVWSEVVVIRTFLNVFISLGLSDYANLRTLQPSLLLEFDLLLSCRIWTAWKAKLGSRIHDRTLLLEWL
ncbi:unnamed protein product [Notodromas monacha]|uniref:Uncharacterized protein n=1 Tax=Notodromas monacha TaxID=399045 RepID=A0A7R9BN41_9CRUS|nr:unnamed protein product [Notodromas monacha]CAG0917048.1 unnamed protein product [Notodromas monacha]